MSSVRPWGRDPHDPVDFAAVDAFADEPLPADADPPPGKPVRDDRLAELDRLAASVKPRPPTPPPPPEPDAEPPQLVYPSVDWFVAEVLSPMWARPIDGRHLTWCPDWWKHSEAVTRLDALWRAWEHLRLDPATGMSVWLRDHADHHMRVLTDPDAGPFKGCNPDRGHATRLSPLRINEPVEGLFGP